MESSKQSLIMSASFVFVVVLVGVSATVTGSAAAQPTGFVDVDASDLEGNGTAIDPYMITNVSELQAMEDNLDAQYILASDINASNTARWNGGKGFDPVGVANFTDPSHDNEFDGSLNGNGHTISNLSINRPEEGDVGLIGYMSPGTVISNISLKEANINGGESVGSLVGFNRNGTIKNVKITGNIKGSTLVGGIVGEQDTNATILNATAKGKVNGTVFVGGIAGINKAASVHNVKAVVDVSGSDKVGGLIGSNTVTFGPPSSSRVENTTAKGRVNGSSSVGGLVGVNFGAIRNAKATGNISGSYRVGGLVGSNYGWVNRTFAIGAVAGQTAGGLIGSSSGGTVKNSYWDIQTTDQTDSAGNATRLQTVQMTGQSAETNMSSLAFGTVWDSQSSSYPTLKLTGPAITKQVLIFDAQLQPVAVGPQSKHNLTFTVSGVSSDGRTDSVNISLPDSVAVETVDKAHSTDTSYNVTVENERNPIELSIDADGSQDTVEINIEVMMELLTTNR